MTFRIQVELAIEAGDQGEASALLLPAVSGVFRRFLRAWMPPGWPCVGQRREKGPDMSQELSHPPFTPTEAEVLLAPLLGPELCCCLACRRIIPAWSLGEHWQVFEGSRFLPPGTIVGVARCRLP